MVKIGKKTRRKVKPRDNFRKTHKQKGGFWPFRRTRQGEDQEEIESEEEEEIEFTRFDVRADWKSPTLNDYDTINELEKNLEPDADKLANAINRGNVENVRAILNRYDLESGRMRENLVYLLRYYRFARRANQRALTALERAKIKGNQ